MYLRQLLPDVSLGTLMKWVRKGAVRVGGKRVQPNARLAEGDVLTLPFAPEQKAVDVDVHVDVHDLVIVFEDQDLLVVDKPAGLASQPGSGHDDSLSERVVRYLGRENAPPGHRPGLAQRLDRDVSGLVPAGKHAPALRVLAEEAATGGLDKRYWALVFGVVQKPGAVDLPLEVSDAPARRRTTPSPEGKTAHTEYTPLERFKDATLLEVKLGTGRTHQIRAHLAAIGLPLLGDVRYGDTSRNAAARELGLRRLFLHAGRLTLRHPVTRDLLHLEAPLPPELAKVLERLRR